MGEETIKSPIDLNVLTITTSYKKYCIFQINERRDTSASLILKLDYEHKGLSNVEVTFYIKKKEEYEVRMCITLFKNSPFNVHITYDFPLSHKFKSGKTILDYLLEYDEFFVRVYGKNIDYTFPIKINKEEIRNLLIVIKELDELV